MKLIEKILAAMALFILFPSIILIVTLIKFDSRGPVFFVSKKILPDGSEARIINFRTFRVDKTDGESHAVITRMGRFLIKSPFGKLHILFSILFGKYSLVAEKTAKRPIYFKTASKIGITRFLYSIFFLFFGLFWLYISKNISPGVYIFSFVFAFGCLVDCLVIIYRYKKRIYGSSAQEIQELISYLESQRKDSSGCSGGGTKKLYPDSEIIQSNSSIVVANGVVR